MPLLEKDLEVKGDAVLTLPQNVSENVSQLPLELLSSVVPLDEESSRVPRAASSEDDDSDDDSDDEQ
jgi:hypothetical protein